MQLVRHLPLARARGCRARVVELVSLAKSADAADGCHALVPGREAAVRCAATKPAAVYGTPGVGIIGKGAGRRLCQHPRRQRERSEHDCSNSHRKPPFVVVPDKQTHAMLVRPPPTDARRAFQKLVNPLELRLGERAAARVESRKRQNQEFVMCALGPRVRGDESFPRKRESRKRQFKSLCAGHRFRGDERKRVSQSRVHPPTTNGEKSYAFCTQNWYMPEKVSGCFASSSCQRSKSVSDQPLAENSARWR